MRFISSCLFPSPISKLSLVLGSCCHLCKLFAISKILPKLLWGVCRTGQQRMPCCFWCGWGSVLNTAWSCDEKIFLNAVGVEICKGKKKSILTNCALNQHYLKRHFELLIIPESSSYVISLMHCYYYLLFLYYALFCCLKRSAYSKIKMRVKFFEAYHYFSIIMVMIVLD